MDKKIHTLLIPDVHGRTFWKDSINYFSKEKYPDLVIVFLGDYLDPYDFEGITKRQAIENFKEIIELAKKDDRVHLLIGNHDMHYWYNAPYKCRCDLKNYKEINKLFSDNFDLFNIAHEEQINGEKYLYTHAGVSSFWLNHLKFIGKIGIEHHKNGKIEDEQLPFMQMLETMTPDADKLNKMKNNYQGQANLWMASYARGGSYQIGSCIWEDWSEWQYKGMEIPGMWQIFGHSRWSKKDPNGADIDQKRKLAMIDSACSWVLTNKGELKKFNKEV